jgi:hypothetical protein
MRFFLPIWTSLGCLNLALTGFFPPDWGIFFTPYKDTRIPYTAIYHYIMRLETMQAKIIARRKKFYRPGRGGGYPS